MQKELHVFEESAHLFWGLVILVCTSSGTYLLAGSFVSLALDPFKLKQLIAMGLFALSFWGIIKLATPLYHFALHFEGDTLIIDIKKGELQTDRLEVHVQEISELKFAPHEPRSSNEALFDFSTSYHLLYKKSDGPNFKKLLGDQSASITLKVNDIANIMRFISDRNNAIQIPNEQAAYFNL